MNWCCVTLQWLPWYRPRFTPLHNTLLRFVRRRRRWGIVVLAWWVIPLRRARSDEFNWEGIHTPGGIVCRTKPEA